MILHNGTFYSMDRPAEKFQALRVENGVIIEAVSEVMPADKIKSINNEIARSPSSHIDCGGSFGVPGFVDTHTHSFEGGFYHNCVSLKHVHSIDELCTLLHSAVPIDGRIIAWQFEEHRLKEERFPTLAELDAALPDTPLYIRRIDGHSGMINTAAAHHIPWEKSAPDISIPLNGSVNHEASAWFHSDISASTILDAYKSAADIALHNGIVRVHTMIGNGRDDLRHYDLVRSHLYDFDIEFVLYPQVIDPSLALEVSSPRLGGCILADGSIGSHTAALSLDYADDPGNKGMLYKTDENWRDIVAGAVNAELDVCVHAIGDRGVKQIADAYASTLTFPGGGERRHQVIHCELTPDPVIEALIRADAACVMQPMFEAYWGGDNGLYAKRLGAERSALCDRLRTLTDAGLLVTGGSDWYITELDALKGIEAAVNHHNPDERINIFEAVSLYTKNAAKLIRREQFQGRLKKGYTAEITFLKEDPMNGEFLGRNTVIGTFINDVYRKN